MNRQGGQGSSFLDFVAESHWLFVVWFGIRHWRSLGMPAKFRLMSYPPLPSKRLALFFDGTWNKPENNTNVWRLSLMLAEQSTDGAPQEKLYDEGVGTQWYARFTGGAFAILAAATKMIIASPEKHPELYSPVVSAGIESFIAGESKADDGPVVVSR
jgi:hypothetical protein